MLSPKQSLALELLLSRVSVDDIAKELSVHRTTVLRWFRDSEFLEEYRRVVRHLFRESQTSILALQKKALATVSELLDSEDDEVRIKAAKLLTDGGHLSYIALGDVTDTDANDSTDLPEAERAAETTSSPSGGQVSK